MLGTYFTKAQTKRIIVQEKEMLKKWLAVPNKSAKDQVYIEHLKDSIKHLEDCVKYNRFLK